MHRKQVESIIRDAVKGLSRVSVTFTKKEVTLTVPTSQPNVVADAHSRIIKLGCKLKTTSGHVRIYDYPDAA